jgi:hypothetical protein
MSIERAGAANYRLVVRGELGDHFGVLFDGMRIAREDGTTVLTGPVADQAHLAGIIDRIHELGLELIFLRLDETPARSADAGW